MLTGFSNRILHLIENHDSFAFGELGDANCPEGYMQITERSECRMGAAFVKMHGLEECGNDNVECKDKKNLSRFGKASCMGLDMLAPKPKIYVEKNRAFTQNSRLICKAIPKCECDHYRGGAAESDTELCMCESNLFGNVCSPIRANRRQKCPSTADYCDNTATTTTTGPACEDNNLMVGMMLPQLQVPEPKFTGITSNCEFLIGVTDASAGVGAGCALFGQLCCATCATIASNEVSLGYITEYRYWLLTIFMGEAFTLEKSEYNNFVANQRYFDQNSIVTVPVAGVYTGPSNIIEYFLVQNPHYTDGRHFIDPSIVADITLLEFSETYVEFTYLATEPNYYISNAPFSRLQAHFKIEFTDAHDRIMDSLIVDFVDSDVQAMVESFGSNAELCAQIQSICTGRYAQFADQAACEDYLDGLPLTREGCPKLKGPTRSCRWTHAILAQPELRPEVHCYHVGPELQDPFGQVKCSIADCETN